MHRSSGFVCLAACLLCAASPARAAEAWLVSVEAPAAVPLGQPQSSLFGPGALPAVAGYRSLSPHVLGGLRLRAGAFANGPAPADKTLRDPGVGGLGSLSLAVRVRPLARASDDSRARGLWVELAGGGGLTGTLLRATAEAGVGWNFSIGKRGLTVGPSLRYLQVVQPSDPLESRDARVGLFGVEVGFLDPRPAPLMAVAPPPPPAAPPGDSDGDGLLDPDDRCPKEPEDVDGFEDQDGCPDPDNDRDGIVDQMDRCPDQAEVVNAVEDKDGCPDEGLIELVGDRIVLEERVLFDTERARVKTAGRRHLAAIAELWKQHPEWSRMTIEGHADVRGPDRFNDWLSEERADRVRAALVELGMPNDQIDTKGYGRTKPRDPHHSPESHQQNRRVEFVIITKKQAAAAAAVSPPPAREPTAVEPPSQQKPSAPAVSPPPSAAAPPPPAAAPPPPAPAPPPPAPAPPPPSPAPPPPSPAPTPPPIAPPPIAPPPFAPPPFFDSPPGRGRAPMSARLRSFFLAALTLMSVAIAGCFDPIVGSRCADGFVPCQGHCVVVCTVDASRGDGSGLDGQNGQDGQAASGDGGGAYDGGVSGDGSNPGARDGAAVRDGSTGDGGASTGDGRLGDVRPGDGGTGDGSTKPATDGGTGLDVKPGDGAVTDTPAATDASIADAGAPNDASLTGDAPVNDAAVNDAAMNDASAADSTPPADTTPPIDCGTQVLCPGGCTNTNDDPDNCGGCGISCFTGLCVTGVCQQRQAGHLVVIGHDYTVSRTGMDNIVGNAVFLAPGTSANVLAYHGAATMESIRGTDNAIQNVAAATGRTWRKTVVAAPDVQSSLAFADVFVIYAQAGASDATLLMLGQDWATALSDFVQAGKTVIVLEGWYSNTGTYQIVQQANLFHATGRAEATGQTVAVARPGDAVATRVPQTYRGERGTVWFSTVDQTVVVQVVTDAGVQPVVIHLVF